MNTKRTVGVVSMSVAVVAILSSCTTTETHTAAGVLTGGTVGAIVGKNMGGSGGREKGAALGAVVGGLVGNQMGAQKEDQQRTQQRLQELEQQTRTQVVWITNSNDSRSSVELREGQGGTWIGPKGETYTTFPTEEQLKKIYGL